MKNKKHIFFPEARCIFFASIPPEDNSEKETVLPEQSIINAKAGSDDNIISVRETVKDSVGDLMQKESVTEDATKGEDKAPPKIPRPTPGGSKKIMFAKEIPAFMKIALSPMPPRPAGIPAKSRKDIAESFKFHLQQELRTSPFRTTPGFDIVEEIAARIADNRIQNHYEAKTMASLFQRFNLDKVQARLILNHLSDIPTELFIEYLSGDLNRDHLVYFDILIDDNERKLTKGQVDALLSGSISKHAVRFLEENLNHPELSTEYIQHIIDVGKPKAFTTNDGRLAEFFEPPHFTEGSNKTLLGEGGIASIYKGFIFERPSYKAVYSAIKKAKILYYEPANAERIIQMRTQGYNIDNIVQPLAIGRVDRDDIIAYEIIQYPEETVDELNRPVVKMRNDDLQQLADDPDFSSIDLLGLLTDATDADLQLRDHGIVDLDTKLENIMKSERGGIKIDLGSHATIDDVQNMVFDEHPVLEERRRYMVPKVDEITGQESQIPVTEYFYGGRGANIGVTPGYYSEGILREVIEGKYSLSSIHNYAYGVMLYRLITGQLPYRFAYRMGNNDLQWTNLPNYRDNFIFQKKGPPHELPDRKINDQIIEWAWQLMNPASGVDAAYVNAEIKKALQKYNNNL